MATDQPIHLYYAPNTRATGVRILLEELKTPYELHVLNFKAGEHRRPDYLTINPMGKVPAVVHGGALVTEQGAIYTYLADLFPEKGLAPPTKHPLRGPYLRWMFFYGSCVEPAVLDKFLQRPEAPQAMSPYGSYDAVIGAIMEQLKTGPFLLGDRYTAADVLWGTALSWLTMFKLVPEEPPIMAYIKRHQGRPTTQAMQAEDARLATEHERAMAATKR
jgi:glutathione S-transferase